MRRFLYFFFKRLFDIFLSLFGIAVFSVPMIFISLLILLTSRGPIIFRQKRVGKNKKLFTIYKFRTMRKSTPNIPTRDFKNSADYITPLGRFLRKTSLDELPQLFNILFGSMTIVGPRPPLYNEDEQINERDKYGVNKLKPGLTGLAQVNGRNESDLITKTKWDAEYLKRQSLWLDFKIMVRTFFQVIRGKNIIVGQTDTKDAAKRPIDVTPEDIARVEAVYDNVITPQFEADTPPPDTEFSDGVQDGNDPCIDLPVTPDTKENGAPADAVENTENLENVSLPGFAGVGGRLGGDGQDAVFEFGAQREEDPAGDIGQRNKE